MITLLLSKVTETVLPALQMQQKKEQITHEGGALDLLYCTIQLALHNTCAKSKGVRQVQLQT